MNTTPIAWTGKTWNPVRGCSKVSPGCDHCYGLGMARRFCNTVNGKPGPYAGLVGPDGEWAGKAVMVPEHLADPLKLRKPSVIFVNSMSDLFHETLTNEEIAAVFGVMAACPKHVFQVLTKRPERALEWFEWIETRKHMVPLETVYFSADARTSIRLLKENCPERSWPLSNVHLGVTVEAQAQAKRIDTLAKIPAALRFVSFEPLLEPLLVASRLKQVQLAIIGCESGPHRRPCEIEWVSDLADQCEDALINCFVKQVSLSGRVSHDPREWPPELRVRQLPPTLSSILQPKGTST